MPFAHPITDINWMDIPCLGERKTFKSIKQRDMWEKLHSKKCEICANKISVDFGNIESSHIARTASSVRMINREREEQTQLQQNMYQ